MTINSLIADLQSLILDTLESQIPSAITRHQQIEIVPQKATIIMGVRRCGKSTYLHQIIHKLLENNIPRENILYLNFFDDRLHELQHGHLNSIMEAYFGLYPEKKNKDTIYLFFDEIQMVTGWEPFVERVMRTEKCEVYISGSSAQMLSKEIATQMRGRSLSWEMFPFSFKEYLDYHQIKYQEPLSTKKRLFIEKAFKNFWQCGGFPEVANVSEALRIKIHQNYYQAILFRDLIERHNISHPKALSDLAHQLIDNIASLYSINSLAGYLKSLGHKLAKTHISDYLSWFEDAYFLFTVPIFDASVSRRKVNPKKIYCIDHALATSISASILVNAGHLLENLVFSALRRQYSPRS